MTDALETVAGRYAVRLRRELAGQLDARSGDPLRDAVERRLWSMLAEDRLPLGQADARRLVTLVLDDAVGMGPLEPLMRDPQVTEVIANGPSEVYAERRGLLSREPVRFRDEAHLRHVIDRIVSSVGRRVDESSPMVDARLADGSRVNAVLPPLAVNGPLLTIRRFSRRPLTVADLVGAGSLTADQAELLREALRSRLNTVISGGTGSGKTTLLNALAGLIDPAERIVTVEDAAELRLELPHVARLESRPPNLEGAGEVSVRALVRNALRMRPDRIVVGEVRGGEALDMLQAMNTGHDGSLTTVHASAPEDALRRIETMALMAGVDLPHAAVREQVEAAVDLVVHVARGADGSRRVRFVEGQDRDRGMLRPLDAHLLRRLTETRCANGS
jgi:pilus assembly protein CpaF